MPNKNSEENWYVKNPSESFSDFFWRVLDIVTLGAMLSAFIWCVVWLVGFYTVFFASLENGVDTETSAFLLTITVLLGHLPKFVAMFVGTDTDFQDFRGKVGEFKIRNAPWPRAIIAAILISVLVIMLRSPEYHDNLLEPLDPNTLSSFWNQTWKNIHFCLLLFAIQVVFSFPEKITNVRGRPIGARKRK